MFVPKVKSLKMLFKFDLKVKYELNRLCYLLNYDPDIQLIQVSMLFYFFDIYSQAILYFYNFLISCLQIDLFYNPLFKIISIRLRRAGIPFRFCTNETQRTTDSLVAKLTRFGFELDKSEVFAPAPAVRKMLINDNLRPYLLIYPGMIHLDRLTIHSFNDNYRTYARIRWHRSE